MKNLFSSFVLIALFALGACSTTSSSGTRTLSADKEMAEPTLRDSAVLDSLAPPADTLGQLRP
ncbi:hypothetical protein ACW9KT_13180 [Hymenobacter sp. HD11105]